MGNRLENFLRNPTYNIHNINLTVTYIIIKYY